MLTLALIALRTLLGLCTIAHCMSWGPGQKGSQDTPPGVQDRGGHKTLSGVTLCFEIQDTGTFLGVLTVSSSFISKIVT